MTRRFWINAGLIVLTGVMMMSCAQGKRWTVYTSKNPAMKFEWAVPAEWSHEAFSVPGMGFSGVTFMEKRKDAKTYQANFVVSVKKGADYGFKDATLKEVADDTAQRCSKLIDARIVGRKTLKINGRDAALIEVAFQGLTQIYAPDSAKVALHQKIAIVQNGDAFYTIRYTNDEKRFSSLDPVFQQALKTFRFLT